VDWLDSSITENTSSRVIPRGLFAIAHGQRVDLDYKSLDETDDCFCCYSLLYIDYCAIHSSHRPGREGVIPSDFIRITAPLTVPLYYMPL
jgi:hypothetical protein